MNDGNVAFGRTGSRRFSTKHGSQRAGGTYIGGKACPLCGSRTGASAIADEEPAAFCPLCGGALPTAVNEEPTKDAREWLERENPELYARLEEKKKRAAARRLVRRRLTILAGVMAMLLLLYVVISFS